eukprot:tig00020848_g14587.t1
MDPSAAQALAHLAAQFANVRPAVIGVIGSATESKAGFLRGLTLKPLTEIKHSAPGEKWSLQPLFDPVHRILYMCLAWLGDGSSLVDAYASPPPGVGPSEMHAWLLKQEAGHARCMLALFHVCHIVLFVQRGRHLSLHVLRQLRQLQSLKQALAAPLAAHGPASPRAGPHASPAASSSVAPGACMPLLAFVFEMSTRRRPAAPAVAARLPAAAPAVRRSAGTGGRPAGGGAPAGAPGAEGASERERAAAERTRRALLAQVVPLLRRLRLGSTLPEGPGIARAPASAPPRSTASLRWTCLALSSSSAARPAPSPRPPRAPPATHGVQGGSALVSWLLADILAATPAAGPAGDAGGAGGYMDDPYEEEEERLGPSPPPPAAEPAPAPRAGPGEDEAAGYSALRAFVLSQVHRLTGASRAAAGAAGPAGGPGPAARRPPRCSPCATGAALFGLLMETEAEAGHGGGRSGPARPARILEARLGPASEPEQAFSSGGRRWRCRAPRRLPRAGRPAALARLREDEEDEPGDGSRAHASGHAVRRACACGRTAAAFDDFFPEAAGPPEADAERWELPGCCPELPRAALAPPAGPASRAYRLGLFRLYDAGRGLAGPGFLRGASALLPWLVDPETDALPEEEPAGAPAEAAVDAAWPTPALAAAQGPARARAASPPAAPSAHRPSYAAALGYRTAAAPSLAAAPSEPFVGAYYGLEYECDAGHRFIAALDRAAASQALPRLTRCPACVAEGAPPGAPPPLGTAPAALAPPGPVAQLVRLYVAVPAEAPATLRVALRGAAFDEEGLRPGALLAAGLAGAAMPEAGRELSAGPYGITVLGPHELLVPRNSLLVLRLPHLYLGPGTAGT